jgi:acetyltransferase-like isoleucine patch superfamily enzyme
MPRGLDARRESKGIDGPFDPRGDRMRSAGRIEADQYVDVEYHQFSQTGLVRLTMTVAGALTWPLILPLALLSRTSDFIFRTSSELLAIVPFLFGTIVRYEFYRFALARCGTNVSIGFGTVFLYRDIQIGDHVLIGMHNTVHYCDFGSYVLIADGCRFLSGSRYHEHSRLDIPMALQGGRLRRICLGDDCWIGANAAILDNVGDGAVVGAGAVVTGPVEPYAIVAGNPARVLRRRK